LTLAVLSVDLDYFGTDPRYQQQLKNTKIVLLSTDKNLIISYDQAQDVTLKKLTKVNPTMAAKFSDLKKYRLINY